MRRYIIRAAVTSSAIAIACGACGGASTSTQPPTAPSTSTSPARLSGSYRPSAVARMVCEPEAHEDITRALGIRTVEPLTASTQDGRYVCRYVFAAGTMTLTVHELRDMSGAKAEFDDLRVRLGVRGTWEGLGQGAFTSLSDAVIVRKDNKILTVDVHALSATLGVPSRPRRDAALSVAATIMGCWTGS